eukprot:8908499-Alexandrium_andersonii.AAC.1
MGECSTPVAARSPNCGVGRPPGGSRAKSKKAQLAGLPRGARGGACHRRSALLASQLPLWLGGVALGGREEGRGLYAGI